MQGHAKAIVMTTIYKDMQGHAKTIVLTTTCFTYNREFRIPKTQLINN